MRPNAVRRVNKIYTRSRAATAARAVIIFPWENNKINCDVRERRRERENGGVLPCAELGKEGARQKRTRPVNPWVSSFFVCACVLLLNVGRRHGIFIHLYILGLLFSAAADSAAKINSLFNWSIIVLHSAVQSLQRDTFMYTGAAIMGLPLLWMLLCFLILPPLGADKILMVLETA